MAKPIRLLPLRILFFLSVLVTPDLALDFVLNEFTSSDLSFYGNASVQSGYLMLTNDTTFSIGRALYKSEVSTKHSNFSFFSSFIFSIAPFQNFLPGHGIVFLFAPLPGMEGTSSAQHLGLFNLTTNGDPNNHVFGVEFDVFENEEFKDIDANHVGVDVNSLTSYASQTAGYWSRDGDFIKLKLNSGNNYQAWVDYVNFTLNVTMAPAGTKKPGKPLISVQLKLSEIFVDEMYIGFCAATGRLVESHRVLSWSFSETNSSIGEALVTSGLPNFVPAKKGGTHSRGFVAGMISMSSILALGGFFGCFFWALRQKGRKKEIADLEEWELEYWPHRINSQEILSATNNFSEENRIGSGGSGEVYKGILAGDIEVAVKCLPRETEQAVKEFLSEISILGRLKHRNLVGLRGWCKHQRGNLVLVYDYMENGSLEKRIFDCSDEFVLDWNSRVKILKDVAAAILYLHEGWESRILHRDIKASNVMLDREMNGRLGDFGLARVYGHNVLSTTTRVVGTVGYMAPELIKNGKASVKTDIFGFGVLILEVLCGRKPISANQPPLIDWLRGLEQNGQLSLAIDSRALPPVTVDPSEPVRLLKLGLACTKAEPARRPTTRKVVKVLMDKTELEDDFNGESMDAYLLDQCLKSSSSSSDSWSNQNVGGYFPGSNHPTFEEIRGSLSSSISISDSDILVEGR